MRWILRLMCWFAGHKWDYGFWETRCRRCEQLRIDRLYQLGYGSVAPMDSIEVSHRLSGLGYGDQLPLSRHETITWIEPLAMRPEQSEPGSHWNLL